MSGRRQLHDPMRFTVIAALSTVVLALCAGLFLWVESSTDDRARTALEASSDENSRAQLSAAGAAALTTSGRGTFDNMRPASEEDFLIAVRSAMADRNEHRQQKAFLDLMEHLSPERAQAVRRLFFDFDKAGILLPWAWGAFWTHWGEIDGAAATEYWLSHTEENHEPQAIRNALAGWAATAPRDALAWLREHRDAPKFGEALGAFTAERAKADLAAATREALSFSNEPDVIYGSLGSLVQEAHAAGGPSGLVRWFDALAPEEKTIAFEHASWRMVKENPLAAREFFATAAAQPWRDDKHLEELARALTQVDPSGTMEWLVALPPSPATGQPAALGTALSRWTQQDPVAASAWLEGHRAESWYAQAAAGYLRALALTNSTNANSFLQSLNEETRRATIEAFNSSTIYRPPRVRLDR